MAKLDKAFKAAKAQGAAAAKQFLKDHRKYAANNQGKVDKYLGGGSGGKRPLQNVTNLNPEVTELVKAEKDVQNIMQDKQTAAQNPNYETPFGSSSYDAETNTYKETLAPTQQGLLDKSQGLANAGLDQALGQLAGYTPFKDPTQQAGGGQMSVQPVGQPQMIGNRQKSLAGGTQMTAGAQPNYGGQSQTQGLGGFSSSAGPVNSFTGGAGADKTANQMIGDYQGFNFNAGDVRNQVQDATYQRLTKNFDRDMNRELEAKQQELYNKGIPFSDDPESRYQKEIRGIQDRYDLAKADAQARAVEMGGSELSRNFGIEQGTYQQGMSDLGQMYGIASGNYGLNLQGQGQQFGQDLATSQQNASLQGQQFGQGLSTHQQNMSDIGQLQGLGTGAIMPNLPGYQAPQPYNLSSPAELELALRQLGLNETQINAEITNAKAKLAFAEAEKLAAGNQNTSGLP